MWLVPRIRFNFDGTGDFNQIFQVGEESLSLVYARKTFKLEIHLFFFSSFLVVNTNN